MAGQQQQQNQTINGSSTSPIPAPPLPRDPNFYAGFTRFELELEFVQALANPTYIHYLAAQKYFEDPHFVAYLSYLQYFALPEYIRYLQYPGTTLRMLELLQEDAFRRDMLMPRKVEEVRGEIVRAALEGGG